MAALVDAFRAPSDSAALRETLAQIAMRLVDPDDRAHFRRADGAMALLDHLARIWEEQATLAYAWRASQLLGATVTADIATEMIELRGAALLFDVLSTLPSRLPTPQLYALEGLRNLSFLQMSEIAADILCNVAFHAPTRVLASQERIAALLALFFAASSPPTLRIALADLLCNLCCDAAYCLLVVYELDARKPARGYQRHSGAVFFADATEQTTDPALRQSMEALAHNVAWSEPAGKRSVQKLGLSGYLRVFGAGEPAMLS
ncbi:hypothetical protein PybrP1_012346 [[Pythium] brassicae (nom. inval.)]|nr:hypothetical protein PybrP1_012346 [[Pythium] brassicae (nom. inval.)]